MKNVIYISVLSFILGFLIALMILKYFVNNTNQDINHLITMDTVYKEIQSEPLILEKARTKIIYKRDTVIQTKPFTAITDTIIKHDTVHAEYEFPENFFSLSVLRKPDTLRTIQIETISEKKSNDQWWKQTAYILGGAFIGYFIGQSNQK
jgi:hypothetical protein